MPSRGYPIGALFVVMTTCAVLVSGMAPVIQQTFEGNQEIGAVLGATVAGGACGLIVGVAVGALQFRAGLGTILGGIAGLGIGVAAGGMAMLSLDEVGKAAAAITAGSALIVGVAIAMRRAA
jgi:hypothetical protein